MKSEDRTRRNVTSGLQDPATANHRYQPLVTSTDWQNYGLSRLEPAVVVLWSWVRVQLICTDSTGVPNAASR